MSVSWTNGVRERAGDKEAPPVLLVSENFPPAVGGSAVLLQNVYSRLSVPVSVITEPQPSREDTGTFRMVSPRARMRAWGVGRPQQMLEYARFAWAIRRAVREESAIVHCGRVLPEGFAAWLAWRSGGPDYVCWSHGEELAYRGRELNLLRRTAYRGARAVIANSANTAAMLATLGLPRERIHVVHPGVDADRFHPGAARCEMRRRFAPTGAELVLLSVGRLQTRKGHDLAIAAVDALRSSLPGLRYVIVGDGEERKRLEQEVATRHLQDRVTFAGGVPENDLPACYAAADIFVHPNRVQGKDFEGFGIVFLEAAASEVPAIGGRSGGVGEAVADRSTGLLVSGTDVGELADAITTLAQSPELRRRMGREGRARVLREFTWERAAARVAEVHMLAARSK